MTIPLVLSTFVAVMSVFMPNKKKDSTSSSSSSSDRNATARSARNSSTNLVLSGSHVFLSGVLVGMGMFWIMAMELQRTRIRERVRLAVIAWWEQKEDNDRNQNKEDDTHNNNNNHEHYYSASSSSLLCSQQMPQKFTQLRVNDNNTEEVESSSSSSGDNLVTVLSPRNALTSTMVVSSVRLPTQRQLKPRKTDAVEFYFVLQGQGICSRTNNNNNKNNAQDPHHKNDDGKGEQPQSKSKINNKTDTFPISKGDIFSMDPSCTRWIANNSNARGSEDLILLRTSDGGMRCTKEGYDVIIDHIMEPNNSNSDSNSALLFHRGMEALTYGWNKLFGTNNS